ncbi:MAG: chitobiase/beta-hexosaminidase C-terminal domain-containing protein [Acutalibacteraceae bacterium]
MLNSCIDTSIIGENNDIWMAKYYNALMNMTPSEAYSKVSSYTSQYSALYGMWQWSSTSSISGISGNVDVDVAYKDYPTIIKSKGLNGFSATTPTAATPTISSSNTTGGKNVTIACSTSGATIYYTTDGSTPTTSSTKYSSAFKVTSSTTVKAIAVASGYNNSSVASSTISVSQTATPTITAANTTGGKNVTIACSTSGATIYYTTDGSTPTTSSTKYTAAFKVTSSTTVKALAVTSGYTNSSVASSTVSVTQTATPTITAANTTGGKSVTIACSTSGATIYYTTDGSTPTTSSTKYTAAFTVTSSATVKALAVTSGYTNSSVASSTVSVTQTATPTITAANTTGGKSVTIACSTSGATIYYTTDGSTPTTSSTKYTAAFTVTSSATVKALAVTSGYTNSSVASSTVSVTQTATPTITAANTTGGKSITIASSTSGATIYYTTDGSTPTTSSTKYTAAFNVTADSTTIKALAVTSGYTNSAVASSTVTVSQVSTPVITIDSSKNVTITCSTSGATVYYTTDGTTPTTSSNVYSSSFKLTTNGATVKAIAVASGYRNSSVATKTAEITKADKPVIAYTDYVGGKYVAFSSTTEGATIYYTTDGTDPTTESKVYTSKFKLSAASYTIKAIAVADGYYDSDIMVETLEIPRVEAPVIAIDGAKNVTITCPTDGAAIYYTIDGTNPTTTSNAYEGTFTLASNGITVKAYAVLKGYRNSSVTSMLAETTKADKPVIAYTDYVGGKYVALTTNTAGATIYYTTDGTDPTTTSKIYTSKFKLSGASYTIKAIAVADGYYDSDIMEEILEIPRVETPAITIGQNNGIITVSISCDTGDSIIYYTTDGTTPSTTSTQYEGIFTIDQEATVSAIATKSGYRNSAKATATYTVLPELVVIDKTDVSINKGETVQLSATVTPDNAKNKAVTWSSSNAAVATVSESGLVTGVADGNATITATTSNGLTATCTVTVIDDSGVYALITSPDYLIHGIRLAIIYNNSVVGKVSSSTMITTDVTVSNGIASNIENEDTWIIEQSGTKYYLKNTVSGKYLGLSSSTSVNTSDTAQAFDIALQSDGTFLITHVESGRYLGYNGSTGFKLYTTGYMNTHPGYVNIYVYNTSGNLPDSKLYTAQALTDGHGTVTNTAEGMSYISGTQVTFTATPNDGYEFNAWVDENGNTVSTDAQYTFSLTSDTVYTATFTQLSCGAVTASPDGGVIKTGSTITLSAASGEKIMYSINGGDYVEYKSAIIANELPMSISAYTTRDNYLNGSVSQFSYTASGVFALIQDSSYIENATENTKFALIYNGAYIGKISSGTALSTAITISNNIITDVNDITSYKLEKNGNYYYIKNSSTDKYLALTTTANSANVVNSDTPAAFELSRQLDGTFIFVHVDSGRYLGYNGSTGFKLYTYSDSNLTKYCGKISVYIYTEDEIPTVNALSSVTICSGGNGTVTPVYTSESIVNGTKLELNAVANSGYMFSAWTDSNGKVVSTNASFTLTVSTTETYIATFTQLVCGKVVADPDSGEIKSGSLITLTTDYDADIMYSINGGEYIKYTGPFTADVFPLTISAYATKQNYATGEVSTYNYTKPVLDDSFNGTFVKTGTLSSISNDSLYIIAVNDKAISSALSSSALTPVDVSASGNKITTDNSSIIWVIQATETDGVYKLMTSDKKYLSGSSSSSNVSLNTTGIEVTITANGDGTFTIHQNNDSGYYLGYNTNTNVFKWYKSTASTYAYALSIYKYDKSAQAVQYYTLNVSTDGNGDLATDMSGTYAENTSITVTAVERSNSTFDGWYNSNGDLLCEDAQYSFTMIEDVTCIAKFIILTVGDPDGNGKVDASDTQLILDYLTNLSSISEKFMEFADYNDDGKVNLLDAYLICLAIINN